MYEQMTLEDAIAAGQRGMTQAADRAGDTFADEAFRFLKSYARTNGRPFASEDVVDMGKVCGLVPPDDRAWGPVFMRAARAGLIRRSTETYQRRRGHGSIGVKWERA